LARAVGEAFWDALNEAVPTPIGNDQNLPLGTLTPHPWAATRPVLVAELKKAKKRTDKRGKDKPGTDKLGKKKQGKNNADSKGDKSSKKGKKLKK
jgi:hypothetical protein